MFDLQRAHQVADAADGEPVVALLDAEQQPGAERIAAAGGIGDAAFVRRRDVVDLAIGMDRRALRTAGDDVGLHHAGDVLRAPAGAFLQQVGFVIVDGDVGGLFDERAQLGAVEQRHRLAWIEHEWNTRFAELPRVLDHALVTVGADDADADPGHIAHMVVMAAHHRARVEGGDLVVVQIGGDEGLRREQFRDFPDVVQRDVELFEIRAIGAEVLPDGRHRNRMAAQQFQVVGDVARAAAELTAHARHQEGHVQDVHLVRQDVVLELVLEHHDGVVGERTADQCRHRTTRFSTE